MKRRGRGTYAMDKPPVLGVVERKGWVRLIPMADVAARTVLRHLFKTFNLENVEALYTDDYQAYDALRSLGRHETVNHSVGEYARGEVHTNTVEAEFSVFRPWNATFRGISKENIHLYTAHYNFLRNNRHMESPKDTGHAYPHSQPLRVETLPHQPNRLQPLATMSPDLPTPTDIPRRGRRPLSPEGQAGLQRPSGILLAKPHRKKNQKPLLTHRLKAPIS